MPWDGSFYEPPGPNEGHCSFSKQNTLRANSSIMASAARSERTCPSQSRLLLRDFSRLPGPNGELAPRLEKMTKARQIAGGGGGGERPALMIYPVELWNPCDFRRFPTTFRKRRNVRRAVFRRRLSTSEAILGDSLVKEPKIDFRCKLLH